MTRNSFWVSLTLFWAKAARTDSVLSKSAKIEGNFHTCYHLRKDEDRTQLTDVLEIYYLDMVKWSKLSEKDIVQEPLHRWLTWLDPGSPLELVEEIL